MNLDFLLKITPLISLAVLFIIVGISLWTIRLQKITNEQLFDKLARKQLEMIREFEKELSKYKKTSEASLQEIAYKMMRSVMDEHFAQIEKYAVQALAKLEDALIQERALEKKWLKFINLQKDRTNKIELLESALNQIPSSKQIFDILRAELEPLTKTDNMATRKHALERLNRAIRIFIDNCSPEDWSDAHKLMADTLMNGNEFVSELQQKRLVICNEKVKQLELLINSYSTLEKLVDAQLDELQKADEQIDKQILSKNQELRQKYDALVKRLVQLIERKANDEADMKHYSVKMVQAIKIALDFMQKDKKHYKDEIELRRIATQLGGWDPKLMNVAAQVYYQSVYAEIFGNVKAELKAKFTEWILNEPKKRIG
jgi:hypothetical protein